jgi:hypothetical protein
MFSITDAAGQPVQSVDASGLVAFDSSTGNLGTVSPNTTVNGNWSWSYVDLVSGAALTTPVLNWHSDAKTADGIWQSVVQLNTTGNVDPFMDYSFSVKNNTGLVQNYAFSYGESIVPPVSGNQLIYADVGGSLTHGAISPVAQLTPTLAHIQTLKLSSDNGLSFVNAGVDVGSAQSRTAFGTTVFGTDSNTITSNLSAINYWQFDDSFSLTPGRDAVALSGSANMTELTQVPEPSTYAAFLGGAVLLGVVLIRRRPVTT